MMMTSAVFICELRQLVQGHRRGGPALAEIAHLRHPYATGIRENGRDQQGAAPALTRPRAGAAQGLGLINFSAAQGAKAPDIPGGNPFTRTGNRIIVEGRDIEGK